MKKPYLYSSIKSLSRSFFVFAVIALVSSCGGGSSGNVEQARKEGIEKRGDEGWFSKIGQHDEHAGLTRDDFKKIFASNEENFNMGGEYEKPSLPDVSGLLLDPVPPIVDNDKLVTLSITEEVPIKEVLIELARRADIDIEIDPSIAGSVIFKAKDKPFSEVIDRLSNQAGFRYSIEGDVLVVKRDVPYIVNYRMNSLNLVRTSSSSMDITTDLSSGGGGDDGSGITGGSSSSLTSTSEEGDLWQMVQDGIDNILDYDEDAESAEDDILADIGDRTSKIMSLNRIAGIISVLATGKEHKDVKQYLDYIQMVTSSQVLIEAKVLEVELDDEYHSGIDWNFLNPSTGTSKARLKFDDLNLDTSVADQVLSIGALRTPVFGLDNTSLDASVKLTELFGTTRTVSNPRLHAMNNQYAMLTFAENFVYFELDVQESTTDTTTTTNVDSEIKTVPIGVIMSLQPSIDVERNEIVMNVRPTLSRIVSSVSDPGVELAVARSNAAILDAGGEAITVSSSIPVVEKRELDTILRIRNGQIIVIGGLIEERAINNDRGVPGFAGVPVVGNAFKSVSKDTNIVETVIFIKATIIPADNVVAEEDRDFYKKFAKDRHKVKF